MNCRSAQRLLSVARDGALAARECAALATHVEECAECRQFRVTIDAAGESLRTAAARVTVPDEERAWQDVRRELRAARPAGRDAWWGAVRWALPLGAAAAVALVAFRPESDQPIATRMVARADFVEVPGNASSVVYVDDQSGWLVVWASAEPGGKGE
jgi:predicted anti-sigma-YlaC factor YlaD